MDGRPPVEAAATRTIEPLSSVNIGEYADLFCTVFNSPPWNDGWTRPAASQRLETFATFPTFAGLGLLIDGTPAGLVLGWGEGWVRGWMFHIKELCIAPAWQGRGEGTRLLAEFERQLTVRGFAGIYLETDAESPAIDFYASRQYLPLGVTSMRKRLAPP